MTIEIDECVYTDGAETVTLAFSDETCTANASENNFSMSTSLDGCGTYSTTSGEEIVFSNTIVVSERVHPMGLVLKTDVDLNVQCKFSTSITGIDANLTVSNPTSTAGTSGTIYIFKSKLFITISPLVENT